MSPEIRPATPADAAAIAALYNWYIANTVITFEVDPVPAAEMARRQALLDRASDLTQSRFGAELVLAADQFIVSPSQRPGDEARAAAVGAEARTVIAGYHWFTDWGRDTMISLEGLTLVTGRHLEAGYILRTFAHYVRDGLIPNMFPEGRQEALYHTADATLWFFHAIARYMQATGDHLTLSSLYPTLCDILAHRRDGGRSTPVLLELKDDRMLTRLVAQVEGYARLIDEHADLFAELFGALLGDSVTFDGPTEKWIVWPAAGAGADPREDEFRAKGIRVAGYEVGAETYSFTVGGPCADVRKP